MYTYSFIIPHKNCPDLLKRCVDSIPVRDDVQIIVVDDNSEEGKKPTLPERKGLEIVLLNASQSKGAGRARNVALNKAKGKWLLFADADDLFSEHLKIVLDKYANDNEHDIVYLSAAKFDENGNFSELYESKAIQDYINRIPKAELQLKYNMWTPWSRMVRREIVVEHKIKFDEIPATNDKMFGLKCSQYSHSIDVVPEVIYHYYRPSFASQTDKKRNSKMFDDILELKARTISLYQEVGYTPIPSMFKIIYSSRYKEGKSKAELLRKYYNCLRKHHLSLLGDIMSFLKER